MDALPARRSHAEDWDLDALAEAAKEAFNLADQARHRRSSIASDLAEQLWTAGRDLGQGARDRARPLVFFFFARHFYLEEIDAQWIDHLKSMDQLREGIGLRGYGQKDPKIEYKKEGYEMFRQMMDRISANVAYKLFRVRLERQQQPAPARRRSRSSSAAAKRSCPSSSTRSAAWSRSTRRRAAARRRAACGDGQAAAEPEKQKTVRARAAQGRPQRALPVRQRQEVQEVPRRDRGSLIGADSYVSLRQIG